MLLLRCRCDTELSGAAGRRPRVLPRTLTTLELAQRLQACPPAQRLFPVVDSLHASQAAGSRGVSGGVAAGGAPHWSPPSAGRQRECGSGYGVYLGPVLREQLEQFLPQAAEGGGGGSGGGAAAAAAAAAAAEATAAPDATTTAADGAHGPAADAADVRRFVDLLIDRRVDMDAASARCIRLPAATTVSDCALLLSIHRCKQAFVTEGGRLVGRISLDSIERSRPEMDLRLPRPPHLTTFLTTEQNGLPRDSQVMAC
eukprot:COSAG01_NODE_1757_length_9317_cov_3.510089_8_plen_257_part_00